ncbi:hypothetical protein HGA64_05535, partial [Candidatus Falkowbacteria bacterium]|nr:hypothetical protein [Candidatus Falkowbacteria bacterium]
LPICSSDLLKEGVLTRKALRNSAGASFCPYCQEPLWKDEMEYIGRCTWQKDAPAEFRNAFRVKTPSFKQYASLLEQGIKEKEREKYVRLHLWWVGNDARRRETSKAPGLSVRESANITALAELLDEADDYEILLKAEVMRELGRFTDAQTLLDKQYGNKYQIFVEVISDLVAKGDTRVRVLAKDDDFLELSTGMAVFQFEQRCRQVNFPLTPPS